MSDPEKPYFTTMNLEDEDSFYCNWCGKMKPVYERMIEKDERDRGTWIGCLKCHGRRG